VPPATQKTSNNVSSFFNPCFIVIIIHRVDKNRNLFCSIGVFEIFDLGLEFTGKQMRKGFKGSRIQMQKSKIKVQNDKAKIKIEFKKEGK
jgi:hypothetical protein